MNETKKTKIKIARKIKLTFIVDSRRRKSSRRNLHQQMKQETKYP
jgi:ribosomal protein L13E